MVRKDAIREKILGLGADVCGFGGMERFIEAPVDFRPTDLYPDCKSVIAVGIALPKGLLRVEPRLLYGHFNADVVHKVDSIVFSAAKIIEKEINSGEDLATGKGNLIHLGTIDKTNATEVLKEYYRQQGKLRLVEGNQPIENAFADILKAIGAKV